MQLIIQKSRRLLRNIENIEKKLINCQLAAVFNETCLNEDILPIYTNIYIYIYVYAVETFFLAENNKFKLKFYLLVKWHFVNVRR